MVHGVKGLLDRDIVDLSTRIKNDLDMDLLKRTPFIARSLSIVFGTPINFMGDLMILA